jgi:hypothetical protein
MTWYEFLLSFHISMAVIWVGGGAMAQLFALRTLRTSAGGFALPAVVLVRSGLRAKATSATA